MNQILDWNAVMDRLDNSHEFFFELFELFFASYPQEQTKMLTAFEASDFEQLSKIAHSMKSALGNLGGMQCHDLLAKLEKAAKNVDVVTTQELLNQLDLQIQKYKAAAEQKR